MPTDARGNGMAVMNTAIFAGNTVLSLLMFLLTYFCLIGGALPQPTHPRRLW